MIGRNHALRLIADDLYAAAAVHQIRLTTTTVPKTHECPKCSRVLAVAEVIERYCAHCGDIDPREVRI
jgi:Zn finger protein HypA/HybF involved in hydrogenase expression